MNDSLTKERCLELIRQKHARLCLEENPRLPKKSDFSDNEIMMIKSFFGPFPRALEAAGVKAPRNGIEQKRRQKRIRAKQNKLRYKLIKRSVTADGREDKNK